MLSLKKVTCFYLLFFFILCPFRLSAQNNNETLQLPERVILGEDKTLTTTFSFREETGPDTGLSLKEVAAKLPSISFSRITVSAGTQENFLVAFSRQQRANLSFGAEINRAVTEPFTKPAQELSFSVEYKKMVRRGILNFSFSVAQLWNLPASKKTVGGCVPAALSEGKKAVVNFEAAFFPEKPLSARASLARHFLDVKNEPDTEAVWPDWSAETGVTAKLNLKTAFTLFLEYRFGYDNPAVEIQEMCLPGASLSYQLKPNNVISLTVRNLTDQRLEILPGYFGPGLTANLSYSRSF